MLTTLASRYRVLWAQSSYRRSVGFSFLTMLLMGGVNIFTVAFATTHASEPVTDIVLSNTPVFDVDQIFVYGTVLMLASILFVGLIRPNRIPFLMYALALFWIIRAGFTSLTHIAPFPEHTAIDFGTTVSKVFFGADLFFSGHTGTPFLIALMFWDNDQILRNFFLVWSIFFATIVLLGHIHYSIDVASAFFITYGIFHIAQWLFPREWKLFLGGGAWMRL